ncbi:MAG: GntR family transcriptional regulator [Candidatus Riflebacteria bacterium]|nr:GntR family transcriptional regulator [Candidatus Riflebacteria bacterium]
MASLGAICRLKVVKSVDFGVYLDGGELGELLLPKKQVPENCKINDILEVFIYHDTESRLITTTLMPAAAVGEYAWMKVSTVTEIGAFLDWGIQKNLFVPFAEQANRMKEGNSYLVHVFIDKETNRITGSSKIAKFLKDQQPNLKTGDEVDILVAERTDLGFKAIINNCARGLLFNNEIFIPVSEGLRTKAYIKACREDGKFDLILQKPGYEKVTEIADMIFAKLVNNGGFLAVTDDSPPELIKEKFGLSKKTFKKAIGALFKEKRISISDKGITVTPKFSK